eukprot:10389657-Karenia_brevis.AAC.1
MEEYFGKGGALGASCNDAIYWSCDPRVKLVTPDTHTCHVHLETQFQHQGWVSKPCGLLD